MPSILFVTTFGRVPYENLMPFGQGLIFDGSQNALSDLLLDLIEKTKSSPTPNLLACITPEKFAETDLLCMHHPRSRRNWVSAIPLCITPEKSAETDLLGMHHPTQS